MNIPKKNNKIICLHGADAVLCRGKKAEENGDISFCHKFFNTGTVSLKAVFRNPLPANFTLLTYTAMLNGEYIKNADLFSGIDIGTVEPYECAEIKFRVKIKTDIPEETKNISYADYTYESPEGTCYGSTLSLAMNSYE